MDMHKEIAKLREQTHVLARLKTKGFLDNTKYLEQTTELTSKINKLQSELKKLTRSDDDDETLEQIEMLIDYFESQTKPISEFNESAFESIVEKIVVISQNELEFYLIFRLLFSRMPESSVVLGLDCLPPTDGRQSLIPLAPSPSQQGFSAYRALYF